MAATDMQQARPQALAPVAIARNSKEDRAHQQYLSFLLGKEMFALGILSVREIIEYGFVTDVPMTPSFIRGVLNLRGAVVPVVDLAVRFGCPRQENTRRTCIVIVEIETPNRSREMGVVVDAVSEVLV